MTAAVPTRIEKWLAALPHANVFVLAHLHRPCAAGAGRAAVFGLYFGVRRGIVIFDRAAKPIYCFGSPVVANRGASYFWIWRWPKVRELFLIIFAGQRGCLFPHLHVSCCWIKECRTSDVSTNAGGCSSSVVRRSPKPRQSGFNSCLPCQSSQRASVNGSRFLRNFFHACSRMTSIAFLSVRSPRKAGCRISPSLVHSANLTSPTSFGRSHVVSFSYFTF